MSGFKACFGRFKNKKDNAQHSSVNSTESDNAIASGEDKKSWFHIRFPWQKNEREVLDERRAQDQAAKDDPTKVKRMRIKFPERHKPCLIGPGYPGLGLVYANLEIARGEEARKALKLTNSGRTIVYEPLKTGE
jgi:hypothetical protein